MSTESDTSSAIKEQPHQQLELPPTVISKPSSSNNSNTTTIVQQDSTSSTGIDEEELVTLSKNKQRKKRNYEKVLLHRPIKRQRERDLRKAKGLKKSLGKNQKLALAEKLKAAFNSSPKVVIDCQYDDRMTNKERTRLSQQLRRVYSSNKASDEPLHLIFASLSESSDFFKLCCKQNDGFANYVVDRREENVKDLLFPNNTCNSGHQEIVYLSPDSANVLTEFNSEKVYVIGAIADESITKNMSLEFSNSNQITTARLPIDEFFVAEKASGTLKKILTVNQVFDIILEWYKTKDWVQALSVGLPERTGFVPRPPPRPEDKEQQEQEEVSQ